MNLAATLRHAASVAQGLHAQLGGMAPGASGNFLYGGAPFTGVFGDNEVDEAMNPGGGFRKRLETTLRATRTQFDGVPMTQTELIRTDLGAAKIYRIAKLDTHDPLHYVFTLVKVG